MRAPAPTSRQPAKRASAGKAFVGPNGLGAHEDDFDTFRSMAPLGQRRTIAAGFEAVIVERVARELLRIPVQSLLSALSLPSSTILRKIANNDRLSQSESDRIARVLYVLDLAVELFEHKRRAAEWMMRGNAELDGVVSENGK
ncbi:antitoxin Xre-like helix-turn-helix domain-containing protein [Burkholderia multivorans]|uniref:antitoxin Xre-like helix-turn-helix domain-containing protein n=1 Tax=Burkholderia multivorans TaxID=87883 RepID=UPI0020B26E7B|nr:antitoxin Xre-like helix-turn-helix domain-containing protein [Burkholderia multivorans]